MPSRLQSCKVAKKKKKARNRAAGLQKILITLAQINIYCFSLLEKWLSLSVFLSEVLGKASGEQRAAWLEVTPGMQTSTL